MRKEKIKKQKGITLIALIITIIVLLILAGVSISVLTGKNGILTKAQEAKNETEAGRLKEENDLALIEELINSNISSTDGYNQTKGVNAPKISTGSAISTGLIPLNWNGSKWVVCSEDNWIYNYSQNGTKQWANAMASDGKYKKVTLIDTTNNSLITISADSIFSSKEDACEFALVYLIKRKEPTVKINTDKSALEQYDEIEEKYPELILRHMSGILNL